MRVAHHHDTAPPPIPTGDRKMVHAITYNVFLNVPALSQTVFTDDFLDDCVTNHLTREVTLTATIL